MVRPAVYWQNRTATPVSNGSGWNEYWRRTREASAHKAGGPQDEVLARFWASFFAEALTTTTPLRLLDVACGNGAAMQYALDASLQLNRPALIVGIDNSHSALSALRTRFPQAYPVLADAKCIPFRDGSFDVAFSQFGVEYAGAEGFDEAARVIAPGGTLAAVMHLRDGAIYRECAVNADAARGVLRSGIFSAATEAFRAGFTVARGSGNRSEFEQAHARLAAAAKDVEAILRRYGDAVAGGAVRRLHSDLADMYRRVAAYDPHEVARWLDRMLLEMASYEDRMRGMLLAALDGRRVDEMLSRLASRGFAIRIRDKLVMGAAGQEAAWAIVCDRPVNP